MDSSGWIEVFRGGGRAAAFRSYLSQADHVLVPAIVVYEVHRVIARHFSEREADRVAEYLQSRLVLPLDGGAAARAAGVAAKFGLSMADAVIYSCGLEHEVVVVTGDGHFSDLEGVEYVPVEE